MNSVLISIPDELKNKIEYFLVKNKSNYNFESFVLEQVKLGLNKEIHKTLRKEKQSILCSDTNPKTSRLIFDQSNVFEYFVCDQCRKDHKYNDPTHEEPVDWK